MNRRLFLHALSALTLAACAPSPRRQDPSQRPYPHRTVRLSGPAGPLVGELVLPTGTAGPAPAVLLVAGSGPQDRDERIAGHRPFLVLADALARAGFASLRHDKRGSGESGDDFATATIEDFARDAGAAFDWLAAQPGIDPRHVAMLGHSEGGLTAPLAARGRAVAALVLLAGPGVAMDRLIRRQSAALAQRSGASAADRARLDQALAQSFAALAAAPDAAQARAGIAAALAPLPAPVRRGYGALLATPWAHSAIRLDPLAALQAYAGPVLALFGGTDLQVDPTENAAALRQIAPGRAPGAALSVEVLPGLNHLFQPSPTGAPEAYGDIETTLAPEALQRITGFLSAEIG